MSVNSKSGTFLSFKRVGLSSAAHIVLLFRIEKGLCLDALSTFFRGMHVFDYYSQITIIFLLFGSWMRQKIYLDNKFYQNGSIFFKRCDSGP
jgi:hypothetical protein